MKIIEVISSKEKKLFHKVPERIYANDPMYIKLFHSMIEENFNPKKNRFFTHGIAKRWILIHENTQAIGRIVAFVDHNKLDQFDQPTGYIGFFECINDHIAAKQLFDTAKTWLESLGIEAMDGPANLGENFVNHGLFASGLKKQGFGMPYNKLYYVDLFKQYGFKVFYEQHSYHVDFTKPFPERFWKIGKWVCKKPNYSFKHFTWKERLQFSKDFCYVYEKAWQNHEHYKEIEPHSILEFIESSKLALNPEFIWFAYYKDEPIAAFAMIPDLNQAFEYVNSNKITPWSFLKLIRFIKKDKFTRSRVFMMGVHEQFQKSGIEAAIFYKVHHQTYKYRPHYKEMELSWAGDFNPKVLKLFSAVGGQHVKTHYQMRYLFDRTKPFKRTKNIDTTS